MPTSFASRLEQAFSKYGQLCIGIDPHSALLEEWGLDDSPKGLREFSLSVLDAAVGRVGLIKPQVAFYERFGSRGFAVLEELALKASETDVLVIMDAKRGDIGSTMDGYFDAWLGKEAAFLCDALTVNPFLGVASLTDVMSGSLERGKGLFVLAATSNPEGKGVQRARIGESTLSADILRQLDEMNAVSSGAGDRLGAFGAVIGATLNFAAAGIGGLQANSQSRTPILAPGFGSQGANLNELRDVFQSASNRVIASVSRSVLSAGAMGLSAAIESASAQLRAGLDAD